MITNKDCWVRERCKKSKNCDEEFCIKLFKINALCDEALLTKEQRIRKKLWLDGNGADREAFQFLSSVEEAVEKFVESGDNLYIHSFITGNGKTAWALRLLNAYLEKIWYKTDLACRGLFVNVPRFLIALKNNISEHDEYYNHIKDNILSADLVVFDEMGAKVATSFEVEHLLSIINARIDAKKANIYTSNLAPDELKLAVGDRMYSRIINCSTIINFIGSDKRGLK